MVVLVKACMAIIQRQNEQLDQILESIGSFMTMLHCNYIHPHHGPTCLSSCMVSLTFDRGTRID